MTTNKPIVNNISITLVLVGMCSKFLQSIRTSICIRKCNKNWGGGGVIFEPFFGQNHGLLIVQDNFQ